MDKKLNCKPITFTFKRKTKYFVKTAYIEHCFIDITEYKAYISNLVLMQTSFTERIQTIEFLYENNTLVNRQVYNEVITHNFYTEL